MPCTEFEDRLAGYDALGAAERQRVDAHVAHCESCRGWLEAFGEADAALRAAYAGVRAPATLAISVRQRVSGTVAAGETCVSVVPEVLDFIAWIGVIGDVRPAGVLLAAAGDRSLADRAVRGRRNRAVRRAVGDAVGAARRGKLRRNERGLRG